MPLSSSINYFDGYINAEVSGIRVPAEIMNDILLIWGEINSLAEKSGTCKVLYKTRVQGERPLLTAYDVLDEFVLKHWTGLIIAYVELDSAGYEDAKLLKTIVHMHGMKFELFSDPEEAVSWLKTQ